MGSFNYTCCVSNLPIEAGTPVRYLALARSAFDTNGNGHVCYVGGRWQVYGIPIKGQYNDYGTVEKLEESFTTLMFFDGLKRGAVEKGVGDNTVHDVPVRPDMSQKEWLDALWEGRVEVQYRKPSTEPWVQPEPEKGIPSIKRMEKLIRAADLTIAVGYGAKGYYVDEASPGYLRIRHGEGRTGRELKDLEVLLPFIHQAGYAAMITVGTGNYANHAEVLVAPLPPKNPNQHIHVTGMGEGHEYNALRPVAQAMVREDVWQHLLGMSLPDWGGGEDQTVQGMRDLALQYVEEQLAKKALRASMTQDQLIEHMREAFMDDEPRRGNFSLYLRGHEGTSGFTYREAYRLAEQLAPDPESFKRYVVELAELIFVEKAYDLLYGQWAPTSNSHQEGFWEQHRAFRRKLATIKGAWEEEDEDEEGDEDELLDEEE